MMWTIGFRENSLQVFKDTVVLCILKYLFNHNYNNYKIIVHLLDPHLYFVTYDQWFPIFILSMKNVLRLRPFALPLVYPALNSLNLAPTKLARACGLIACPCVIKIFADMTQIQILYTYQGHIIYWNEECPYILIVSSRTFVTFRFHSSS
jgi:hypothetical protein